MRNESLAPGFVGGLHPAGIGKPGLFLHRQRVKLGAHHRHRACAVVINRHNPGLADMFGHRKAELAHPLGQQGSSALFLKPQFGVAVQIDIERVEIGPIAVDHCVDRSEGRCRMGCRDHRQRGGGQQEKSGHGGNVRWLE